VDDVQIDGEEFRHDDSQAIAIIETISFYDAATK
jgi:hypothetical protein